MIPTLSFMLYLHSNRYEMVVVSNLFCELSKSYCDFELHFLDDEWQTFSMILYLNAIFKRYIFRAQCKNPSWIASTFRGQKEYLLQ